LKKIDLVGRIESNRNFFGPNWNALTLTAEYVCARFSSSGLYFSPADGCHQSYVDYIRALPLNPNPEVFGLHENADITKDNQETTQVLSHIIYCSAGLARPVAWWCSGWGVGLMVLSHIIYCSAGLARPVAWWCSGWGVGLATPKVAGSTLGLVLSGNNLGKVVHTHVPLSPSSTVWYQSVSSDALRLGR